MIIDKSRTYRTRDGREVRIYAMDGAVIGAAAPVHGAFKTSYGWECTTWYLDGRWTSAKHSVGDLIPADPHGILPRHRELLADMYAQGGYQALGTSIISDAYEIFSDNIKIALCALAKLDAERSVTGSLGS
jgi:hypothetical protein